MEKHKLINVNIILKKLVSLVPKLNGFTKSQFLFALSDRL